MGRVTAVPGSFLGFILKWNLWIYLASENAQLINGLIFLFIHLFTHSFIHAMFLEYLLYAGHCVRCCCFIGE